MTDLVLSDLKSALDTLTTVVALAAPFYEVVHWLRHDRRAFRFFGGQRAMYVGLVITVGAAFSGWLYFRAIVMEGGSRLDDWLFVGFTSAWTVLVYIATPRYRILRVLTRDDDPRLALRRFVWALGDALPYLKQPDADPVRVKRAQASITWLGKLRTKDTAPIIDLWLAEVAAVRSGHEDSDAGDRRHEAIRAEARRLWPDSDGSESAALVV